MSSTSPEMGISPAEPRKRFCADCGAEAGQGNFCASCGAQLATGIVPERPMSSGVTEPSGDAHSASAGAPASPTYDETATGGFVPVDAVARQTTEYVEVTNLGVIKLASIGQRVLARVLDVVVVVIAVVVLSFIAAMGRLGSDPMLVLLFLVPVIAYLYEIVMVTFWGRTVGKMLVGARIIRAGDGMKPSFGNAFLRWLAPGLGGFIPVLGPLGQVLVLLSPTFDSSGRRQGWHDKMAGTLVVEVPRASAPIRL